MNTQPAFTPAPVVKVMINIGALLDITTGTYMTGRHGESILNGGLSMLTGITGIGNSFKSTFMHYQSFTACARMKGSSGSTYDTEVNKHEWHLNEMIARIKEFKGENIIDSGRWVITDKTVYSGNQWYEIFKNYCEDKIKNSAKMQVETPFWARDKTGPLTITMPTFTEVDSFTEFETDDVIKMQDANELGDSGANTIHMRQGLAKMRLLMEAPRLNGGSYNYFLTTAHIGKESTMQSAGGGREIPIVTLKHLKNGDKIMGVTKKFTFIMHNCWHAYNTKPEINDGTKGPEYPRNAEDNLRLDTDLTSVQFRNLRSKSGVSGTTINLIVSQTEGVLASLTEFHHIREYDYYGLEGNKQNYCLAILPEVKLSRTTVRGKIDSDLKLQRALNITSEMCQMSYLWHHLDKDIMCTPKQLYDDLKAQGYDWDMILSKTRSWWTINNEDHELKFLSTMDLMNMRAKRYFPYWMNEDKTIKVKKK